MHAEGRVWCLRRVKGEDGLKKISFFCVYDPEVRSVTRLREYWYHTISIRYLVSHIVAIPGTSTTVQVLY